MFEKKIRVRIFNWLIDQLEDYENVVNITDEMKVEFLKPLTNSKSIIADRLFIFIYNNNKYIYYVTNLDYMLTFYYH